MDKIQTIFHRSEYFICFQGTFIYIIFTKLPKIFMWIASSKRALKSTEAAQWINMLTVSCSFILSYEDSPRLGESKSPNKINQSHWPAIGMIFLKK